MILRPFLRIVLLNEHGLASFSEGGSQYKGFSEVAIKQQKEGSHYAPIEGGDNSGTVSETHYKGFSEVTTKKLKDQSHYAPIDED